MMRDITQLAPLILMIALTFDLAFGELPHSVHPVVWMGKVISWMEKVAPSTGASAQLAFGSVIALAVPMLSAGVAVWALKLLEPYPFMLIVASSLVLTSMFAIRSLGRAAYEVHDALDQNDIPAARIALRSLCSRDSSTLNDEELTAATIESLAENTSDSVVAPLFYYVLFGIPGAVAYRAINTLDAMIGYRGRYEYLGKASARLDDVLNFIPARLTATFLLLTGLALRLDCSRAVAWWWRDSAKTESPNAGRPMAAMAGLLGVRLEKAGHYQLGDAIVPVTAHTIRTAWLVVMLTSGVAAAFAGTVLAILQGPILADLLF